MVSSLIGKCFVCSLCLLVIGFETAMSLVPASARYQRLLGVTKSRAGLTFGDTKRSSGLELYMSSSNEEGIKPMQLLALVVSVVGMINFYPVTSNAVMSSSYDDFASSYDTLNDGTLSEKLGIAQLRAEAGRLAKGKVLEVAVGTGLELKYYNWENINEFVGVDFSEGMLQEARTRLSDDASLREQVKNKNIILSKRDAAHLGEDNLGASNSYDTVVDTFSLCVFNDPKAVLQEMYRVVKPGGHVLLVENSISKNPYLASFQRFFAPVITPFSKNCNPSVDVPYLAGEVGLHSGGKGKEFLSGMLMFEDYTKN